MDIWNILGIEPVKDENEIKKAYRRKLVDVNPEDDPEGFMKLRQAYEEACQYAAEEITDDESKEELQGVSKLIDDIYNDFERRIDVNAWRKLFDTDEFVALETSEDSFEKLIIYLLQHSFLPGEIYALIVDTFDIEARKRELSEKFSQVFIDFMIGNAKYDDALDYHLLEGNVEHFEEYIEDFYKLERTFNGKSMENSLELIDKLKDMDVEHPYLKAVEIRYEIKRLLDEKRNDKMIAEEDDEYLSEDEASMVKMDAEFLYEEYPDKLPIISCLCDVYIAIGDYDNAERLCRKALELRTEDYGMRGKLAYILCKEQKFQESRDIYMKLLKVNHYDNGVWSGMQRANQGIISENEKKLEENPEDERAKLEIAWSCYQSYMFDKGLEVLEAFTPNEENICEYNNIKGRTYLCKKRFEEAKECFLRWKEELENIPADEIVVEVNSDSGENNRERHRNRKRYPYVCFLIAECYLKQKQLEKAEKYLEIPLSTEHEEQVLALEANCELKYEQNKYEECIIACDRLMEVEARNYIAYIFKSKACYIMGLLQEAYDNAEKAIVIYPSVVEPYVQEIKLFQRIEQFDNAAKVIERYRQIDPDSVSMGYYEARNYAMQEKFTDAERILCEITSDFDEASCDLEDYENLYIMLGEVSEKLNKRKQAIGYYKTVLEIKPEHKEIHGFLGDALRKNGNLDEAMEEYRKQLEIQEHPALYINMGLIYKNRLMLKEAISCFEAALKLDPGNSFCYSRLGIIYQMQGDYNDAIDKYNTALMCVKHNDNLKREILKWQARAYACMLKFDDAIEVLRDILENNRDDIVTSCELAELLVRANRFDEAEKLLQDGVAYTEEAANAYMYLSLLIKIYGDEGYLDNAYNAFLKAKEICATNCKLYADMAKVFADMGRYNEAVELYKKAVEVDKNNNENYYSELIEALYNKSGRIKPKCNDYIRKALIPENMLISPEEYIKMSRLFRMLKKYDQALEYVNKALKDIRCYTCWYGGCEAAYYEKGLIYEAIKDKKMAINCIEKALKINGHCGTYERKLKGLYKK